MTGKCKWCSSETVEGDECHECLADKENGIDLEERKRMKEKIKNAEPKKQYPNYGQFCDSEDKKGNPVGFKSARVAKWLKEHEHFKTDRKTDFLYYGDSEKGVWELDTNAICLREIVTKIMGDNDTRYHFNNILHTLKGLTTEDIEFSKKISLENGLFDLEAKKLTPHSLEEMPFFKYPVTYNPEANDLDDWLAYLNEVANPEDLPLLQEWMGFCLYPNYRVHAALWVHGGGRNGKGVFDRTIQGLVGKDNCCHISLMEINSRFALKEFYGKVYYSNSEPIAHKPFRTENFKRLTGGDPIDAEFKNKNERVRFVNRAKITIIGNKFPKIENPTVAFKDRMIFVKFQHFIEKEDRIPDLENIWLNDAKKKSAIFNWALEGLYRLLSNNKFSVSKSQAETELEFQRVADVPNAFITEMGIIDKNLTTTRSEAWNKLSEYCEGNGLDLPTKSEFTKAMQMQAPKVKDGKIRIEGKQERAWIGFGVKNGTDGTPKVIRVKGEQSILVENENAVPSVPVKNCSQCAYFRTPSCEAESWETRNGNTQPLNNWCFKPKTELLE